MKKTEYEWTARSGVRVESSQPRAEVPWAWALVRTWTYAFRKYLLGKRDWK